MKKFILIREKEETEIFIYSREDFEKLVEDLEDEANFHRRNSRGYLPTLALIYNTQYVKQFL